MSDFYEVALLFAVKPDTPQEATDTLQYMVYGRDSNFVSSLSNPLFSEPTCTVTLPSGVTMRVIPSWRGFFADGHSQFEEYLPGSFGSSFVEHTLAVRQIIHEDAFFNVWYEISDWLTSISATTGLVGYYRNLEDDSIEDAQLICFGDGQITEPTDEDVQAVDDFLQNLETILSVLNE